MTPFYYRGAKGIVLMYDVTSWESFENIKRWLEELENKVPENAVKILVGNKCDCIQRQVSYKHGENLAKDRGMRFIEASGKDGTNVPTVFFMLVKDLLQSSQSPEKKEIKATINISEIKTNKVKCCSK